MIVDLRGKGSRAQRPCSPLGEEAVDQWAGAAKIQKGRVFRSINKAGVVWGEGMTEKVVWSVVREYAAGLAPHDLRRTCAKLCRAAGGELEQIQFLLGHASIQTTERYLGTARSWRMR